MATIPTAPPPQIQRQLATRTHGTRLALLLLLLVGGAVAVGAYVWTTKGATMTAARLAGPTSRPWLKQAESYPDPEKPVETAVASPVDTISPELARLRQELLAMRLKMEELDKRKTSTTVVQPPHPAAAAVQPPAKRPAQMLYFNKELQDTPLPVAPAVPEYTLAAWATRLPCLIEPLMNSDVPGAFTAKVSTNVYDTRTGRHLLVPQGATVGGTDRGETLPYGNERLPTVALALTIEDRTYDLGQAPVTDQLGTNGLTGDVDQHYGRLLAAVLIQGVLKGGATAITEAAGGTVVSGFTSAGSQATNKITGPMLNTRPTIRVFPGQICSVLLTKELKLPAVWQGATQTGGVR